MGYTLGKLSVEKCSIPGDFPIAPQTPKPSKKPDPAINWCALPDGQFISIAVEAKHN